MTSRQKYIVAALAAINGVVILTLVVLVTRTRVVSPPALTPSADARHRLACQQEATQLLARAGLGGIVFLASDELRFEIVYPLSDGRTMGDAAQQVWKAFDIASSLSEDRCDLFSQVEVVIRAERGGRETRITAQVSAADLRAFYAGELDEKAFIERVSYNEQENF
jgi:hypothetical protein